MYTGWPSGSSRLFRVVALLAVVIGLSTCVATFDPTITPNTTLLVVEGILTDQPVTQAITLSQSTSTRDSSSRTPVSQAQVQLIINGTQTVLLTETQPGRYELQPGHFSGRVGDSYQLRFQTANGSRYESTVETMVAVPAIQRVYDQFNPKGPGRFANELYTPSNDIFVDFQDPAGQPNFYLWRTRVFEAQEWCASCQQGRYILEDIGPVGTGPIRVIGCVPDSTLGVYNFYDYICRGSCWDIFYSTRVNVFADVYANGRPQVGRLVAQVPVYQREPAVVDVEQLSLTVGAYRYYRLFEEQTQNTGTLVDTPPAPTVGNVRNLTDPSENVVGYFSASSVAINHYWLSRRNVPLGNYRGLFYAQNRRYPNIETSRGNPPVYGVGVPSAVCIPSPTRTNVQPEGWQ
ncbi:DUF4249 domain-containing protein [Spirosoma sordidisoli]|uniref:DUF4249 domain-containing protein n=1 Tax=Spirosoma sordidisoli TaxID=2502893 RepID=A0A4Q2URA9_9BACT|nr:DUF4249 domain-containing protein [Spirosoma sordidisoli]RYC69359.1 DUF4249 domain-containing protein [Spirosoma sordidisoli]